MARANVPVSRVSHLVPVPLYAAVTDAANDMQLDNDGHTYVLVVNTGGTTRTFEAVQVGTQQGVLPAPVSYSITGNAFVVLGPYDPGPFGQTLQVNSNHADLAVRAFTVFAPPL